MRFKRTSKSATTAVDTVGLTPCPLCGQAVRVDETTGRCVLGHRVFAVEVDNEVVGEAGWDTAADATAPLEPVAGDTEELWTTSAPADAEQEWPSILDGDWVPQPDLISNDPAPSWAAPFSEPVSEASPVEQTWEPAAWDASDPVDSPWDAPGDGAADGDDQASYRDLLGWDAPGDDQPAAGVHEIAAPDDIDDERYVRRRALGVLGGVVSSTVVFGAALALAF